VIDLSRMKSVRVDPVARRATVEPGCTLGDVDDETQAFGLALPLGINSTTGVAGLTLGGGFGWLSRRYGMTIDSLISADVVTADGELVRCSHDEHQDLFWAIRGGGGNFGVVTMFEFQLHTVGPLVYGGLVVLPFDQAKEAFRRYREAAESMPDELTVWGIVSLTPPLPFVPAEVHGKPMVGFAVCYTGPIGNGPRAVEAVRGFGTPVGEQLGPMPFTVWQQTFDQPLAPGGRNYWKSHNLSGLEDGLVDTIMDAFGSLPTPEYEVLFGQLGGATARVAADATAYPARDTVYVMNIHARWSDAADDARCIAWARALFDNTKPYALGSVYVNFMTGEETGRIGAVYGPNYERLAAVKSRYDPHNLFRNNQNIKPSPGN
jgi:FAD/FMN-containing dehydrogenase